MIAIFIILGSTGLKILIAIFEEIREIIKSLNKKNKIHNEKTVKSKKN